MDNAILYDIINDWKNIKYHDQYYFIQKIQQIYIQFMVYTIALIICFMEININLF